MEGLSAAASLVQELDKRLLVVLRDGRQYIGLLRSFDQFSNIVLEEAVERVTVDTSFADLPLGLYIVRGENVVLLGALEGEAWRAVAGHTRVSAAEISEMRAAERASAALKGSMRARFDFLDAD